MKTPGEIKKGLKYCGSGNDCSDECPYYAECLFYDDNALEHDSLSYIAQLEETICLMKIQMRGDCGCCKHGGDGDMKRCNECLLSREYHPLWEYEGLPEVEVYESEMPVLR